MEVEFVGASNVVVIVLLYVINMIYWSSTRLILSSTVCSVDATLA